MTDLHGLTEGVTQRPLRRRSFLKWSAAVGVSAAFGSILAACGGDDDDDDGGDPTATGGAATTATTGGGEATATTGSGTGDATATTGGNRILQIGCDIGRQLQHFLYPTSHDRVEGMPCNRLRRAVERDNSPLAIGRRQSACQAVDHMLVERLKVGNFTRRTLEPRTGALQPIGQ